MKVLVAMLCAVTVTAFAGDPTDLKERLDKSNMLTCKQELFNAHEFFTGNRFPPFALTWIHQDSNSHLTTTFTVSEPSAMSQSSHVTIDVVPTARTCDLSFTETTLIDATSCAQYKYVTTFKKQLSIYPTEIFTSTSNRAYTIILTPVMLDGVKGCIATRRETFNIKHNKDG